MGFYRDISGCGVVLEVRAWLPTGTQIEWLASPLPLWHFRKHMKRINFAVTVDELRLLASLASDQLFRRQFIDPKIPGYKGNPEEVALGKALVGRMRLMIDGGTRPYQIGRA
jgi:hypothetical protein